MPLVDAVWSILSSGMAALLLWCARRLRAGTVAWGAHPAGSAASRSAGLMVALMGVGQLLFAVRRVTPEPVATTASVLGVPCVLLGIAALARWYVRHGFSPIGTSS